MGIRRATAVTVTWMERRSKAAEGAAVWFGSCVRWIS